MEVIDLKTLAMLYSHFCIERDGWKIPLQWFKVKKVVSSNTGNLYMEFIANKLRISYFYEPKTGTEKLSVMQNELFFELNIIDRDHYIQEGMIQSANKYYRHAKNLKSIVWEVRNDEPKYITYHLVNQHNNNFKMKDVAGWKKYKPLLPPDVVAIIYDFVSDVAQHFWEVGKYEVVGDCLCSKFFESFGDI